MKKILGYFLATPMLFVFVYISFVYGLSALGQQAEINRYAIVTAIGIDLVEDGSSSGSESAASGEGLSSAGGDKSSQSSSQQGFEAEKGNGVVSLVGGEIGSWEDNQDYKYEVSLLTFMPIAEQTFTETYKVVSSKGLNISKAMDFAGLKIGRQVGLSHVKIVILNEKLLDEEITNGLDFLIRNNNLETSTKLVVTDSSAKEFLNVIQQIHSQSSIKLSELINYNANYIYATDASFETFFNGYFGPTKTSCVPFLRIEKETENRNSIGSLTASQSNEKSSQASNAKKETGIVNNGDTLVFKDGKTKVLLSGVQMKRVNLLNGNYTTGTVIIEDVNDDYFDNANLSFDIVDKNLKYKIVYENGVPVFAFNFNLSLTLAEVENQGGLKEQNIEVFVLSPVVVNALKQKVKEYVAEAIEIMRDNQTDITNIYTIMHNSHPVKFQKFLNSLEDKENYLNHIVFKVGVNIFSK